MTAALFLSVDLDKPTRAAIVATLGPASDTPEMIRRLIEAGVLVFRLNFSHGSLDDHLRRLKMVRSAAAEMNRPVAVLGDLCGPKIRVGKVPPALVVDGRPGAIMLSRGQDVYFRSDITEAHIVDGPGGPVAILPTTYPQMIREVEPGQRVLINDGAVRLLAIDSEPDGTELRCQVTTPGIVTSGKGINLPSTNINAPAITDRDWECVAWAVQHDLDYLALSFVRHAREVRELTTRLASLCPVRTDAPDDSAGSTIPVISKIEKPQALEDLDAIIDASDAIMVARGDLGVEMDIASVPVAQKKIVSRCRDFGKPCIVATQMLETMIESAMPTRAEASDVANAIFDGADAVMLSAETAAGKHPTLVVETMRRIVAAAEARIAELPDRPRPPAKLVETRYRTAALAHGAWHIARDVGAKLIVCWSQSGGTARYLSQNDFRVPIIAHTSSLRNARRMALFRGVTPLHVAPPADGTLRSWTDFVEADLLARGWARHGDTVILLAGKPLGIAKATNSIAIFTIGDPEGGYRSHRS